MEIAKHRKPYEPMPPVEVDLDTRAGKCQNRHCRKGRGRKRLRNPKGHGLCPTCRSRRTRQGDPQRYYFQIIKQRAERYHIPFDLELEAFRAWLDEKNWTPPRPGEPHGDKFSVH